MSFTEEEVEDAWESTLYSGTTEWANMIDHYKKRYIAFANALLAKREGEPIALENVREGDRVRGTTASPTDKYSHMNGGIVEGVVYTSEHGGLEIVDWPLDVLENLRILNHPDPRLPTEPGSLIEAYEVRGVKGKWHLRLGHSGYWRSFEKVRSSLVHLPEDITSWKPADFVVRES